MMGRVNFLIIGDRMVHAEADDRLFECGNVNCGSFLSVGLSLIYK